MLVLYILLGFVLLLLLLLLIPVRLRLEMEAKASTSLSWVFLKFRLLSQKPRRRAAAEAEADAEKEKKKGENLFSRTAREEGAAAAFQLAAQTVRSAADKFLPLFRRMVVELLWLEVDVATPDAAKTEMEYGGICAAVFPLRGFLGEIMTFSRERIVIPPDFSGEESRVRLRLRVRLRPIFAVWAAIRFLCELLLYKWKNRKTGNGSKVKDGAKI